MSNRSYKTTGAPWSLETSHGCIDHIYGRRGIPPPEIIKGLLMPEMVRQIGGCIDTGHFLEKLNVPHKDIAADAVQRIHIRFAKG